MYLSNSNAGRTFAQLCAQLEAADEACEEEEQVEESGDEDAGSDGEFSGLQMLAREAFGGGGRGR